jgi:tRNA A58 N-methylase Trm61
VKTYRLEVGTGTGALTISFSKKVTLGAVVTRVTFWTSRITLSLTVQLSASE